MNKQVFCFLMVFGVLPLNGQVKTATQNIILITLDGFRWQELFRGADLTILNNRRFVREPDETEQFVASSPEGRRKELLPFFWNTIASGGQLYGNRDVHNYMDCSNPYWFSYPGYHEMLVGAVDRSVCSNLKVNNPNSTVLGFLNKQSDFRNSVAAFSTWDVFPYILRESDSGIPVNPGLDPLNANQPPAKDENKPNQNQMKGGRRTDSITFQLALEYLKQQRPRVLYIALDETDYYAHEDRYDHYLMAAHQADQWMAALWNWLQSDSDYRDKTTLLITTDHGRGQNSKKSWRHHGRFTRGSGQIWMAAIGPDTPSDGEMKMTGQLYQKQIAKTIAALVGLNYENTFQVGNTIQSLIRPVQLIAEHKLRPKISGNR